MPAGMVPVAQQPMMGSFEGSTENSQPAGVRPAVSGLGFGGLGFGSVCWLLVIREWMIKSGGKWNMKWKLKV